MDSEESCGFYNRSNGGVRQKLKTGSQCESVLLRCLTPARLIRMKQITSDEALSNQLLRLYHKSSSGLRRVTAIIKRIRKDSKKSSALTKLQNHPTKSQHNFTPSTMFSFSFHFSYFLRRYGILCLSLNNFKEA